jgi:hypothetical protein
MSDFKTALVEDARIAMVTDEEVFGVKSSASQSTYQQFQAISQSNSSITFNIQVPSENILIDRHIRIQSTIAFTLNIGNQAGGLGAVPAGALALNYGLTDSLQAFPLNSLFTTAQLTINNVSTSTNYQDVLPMLMRMNDNRMLSRYNSTTPAYPDSAWGEYPDAIGSNSNPLASFNNDGYDIDFSPRGAYPVTILPSGIAHYINGVLQADHSLISTSVNDTWVVQGSVQVTEPFLFLSPLINSQPGNSAGLIGVNNMSLVLNIDSTCKRFWSTGNGTPYVTGSVANPSSYIQSITLGNANQPVGFSNTRLLFNFLSLQPEQYAKISTKNIVPYLDYPRYITSSQTPIGPANTPGVSNTASLTSASLQLNQVPDLILVGVRVPMANQNWSLASSFLTINKINVSFNNSSGLLASATQQDLWDISVRNGSQQEFLEFSGSALVNQNFDGYGNFVPTTGSLLVLDPVYDFSLPSYLSSSSLGQYQLLIQMEVTNQFNYSVTPEIVIITINSGLFATQQGTSQIFTGILTKDQILKTKEENPVPHLDTSEYARLVGGKSGNLGMSNIAHMLKRHLKKKMAEHGGAHSGGATSGGAFPAAVTSGAARRKISKHC